MCCLVSALLLIGPRLAFVIYWLLPITGYRVAEVFGNWVIPLLGLIFLPWTALSWVILYPVQGFEWFLVVLALFADLAAYGGGYRSRGQLWGD